MGQSHPTLVLSFTSPLPHNEIVQQLTKAVRSDARYQLIGRSPGTDTQSSMELLFTTPGCGWLDKIRLIITTEANHTIINVLNYFLIMNIITLFIIDSGNFAMYQCVLWLVWTFEAGL